MKNLLFLLLCLSIGISETKYCGYDEVIYQIDSVNPGFKASADFIYDIAKKYGNEFIESNSS